MPPTRAIEGFGQSELTEQAAGEGVLRAVGVDAIGHGPLIHREAHIEGGVIDLGQLPLVHQAEHGPGADEAFTAR